MLDLVLKGLWETIYMTVGATVLALSLIHI